MLDRCVICNRELDDDDHHTSEYDDGYAHDECIEEHRGAISGESPNRTDEPGQSDAGSIPAASIQFTRLVYDLRPLERELLRAYNESRHHARRCIRKARRCRSRGQWFWAGRWTRRAVKWLELSRSIFAGNPPKL